MTLTAAQKLNKEFSLLKREVQSLRSFIVASQITKKDEEGEYRPEFIKRILQRAKHSKPTEKFKNATSFLVEIERA